MSRVPNRATRSLRIVLAGLVGAGLVGAGRIASGMPLAGGRGAPAAADPMIMVTGDIACPPDLGKTPTTCHHRETSDVVVNADPDKVLTTGDNQYEAGGLSNFRRSYDDTWGRFKGRTRPTPGNHEYRTSGAAGYFDYFGRRAGRRGRGYYSFDLGDWHLIALNSEIAVGRSSKQVEWLRKNLTANPARCTLAYFHRPRFSSGEHGSDPGLKPLWRKLFEARVDLVVNGHDHGYERFAPMEPDGERNGRRGIRQFVVGTGGVGLRPPVTVHRHSRERQNDTFGVLKLRLHTTSYSWDFVPEAGATYRDSGSDDCH